MLEQTDVKKSYSTNGSQITFPVPFPFDDPSHIEVWIRNNTTKLQDKLVNPGDYTVSGSNVIMVDVWPAGYTLWVYRIHPETQTLDLIENDNLPAESLEKRFDKLTQMVQQLQEQFSRAILFPKTTPFSDLEFPEPAEDKFLVWKDGKLVNGVRFISGEYTVQNFMGSFLEGLTPPISFQALGADANWHFVGDPGEPTFLNGWENWGDPYGGCAFMIDAFGRVWIMGRVKNGTLNTVVFVLPVNYRPPKRQVFASAISATGWVQIDTNGEVKIIS
jgi:hypothetical protein